MPGQSVGANVRLRGALGLCPDLPKLLLRLLPAAAGAAGGVPVRLRGAAEQLRKQLCADRSARQLQRAVRHLLRQPLSTVPLGS